MAIRFHCSCGKSIQVNDEHAGKKARCPGCGGIVQVPANADAFEEDEPRSRRRAPAPRDDDDAYAEEDRYGDRSRRRRQGMAGWLKVTLALVALTVLAGGGFLLYWVLAGPGGPGAEQLALVPRDAAGFVTVRVSELWNSKLLDKVRAEFGPKIEAEIKAKIGLGLEDIDRVTFVVGELPDLDAPGRPMPEMWAVVHTKVAYDKNKILSELAPHQEHTLAGKTYYTTAKAEELAVHFAGDKEVWLGTTGTLRTLLDGSRKIARQGPLADALALAASNKHHIVLAGQLPEHLRKRMRETPGVPAEVKPFLELTGFTATLGGGGADDVQCRLKFAKADAAGEALAIVKLFVGKAENMLAGIHLPAGPGGAEMLAPLKNLLRQIKVEQQGAEVVVTVPGETLAVAAALALPAVQKVREAAMRTQVSNNMRQMLIAMHNYEGAMRSLPPARFRNGLSWRVALLPYIEEQRLYQEFHLDEPWDSPHNKKLLGRMPKIYEPLDGAKTKAGHTCYQVFTGENLVFHAFADNKVGLGRIPDGTSNTLFIVEASNLVPWTAPEDIRFDPSAKGTPPLGHHVPGQFLAGFGDVIVRWIPSSIDAQDLRILVDPRDNRGLDDLRIKLP